jgi:hypothetical protein
MDELFRVWIIPQVPMEPFRVECKTLSEARRMADALALFQLFMFRHKAMPDYSNDVGVERLVNGEWEDVDDDELNSDD